MSDALSNFQFKAKDGLFVRLSADSSPRKMRILTTDPVVSIDKFGNTRFAFIVWDYNEDKARILNTTPGLARQIQQIHQDEDFGADIQKVDVKIVTTGSELETRHTVTALPKSETLTSEQVKDCKAIDLDEKIENGTRMSLYNPNEAKEEKSAKEEPEEEIDEDDGPADLSEIPF